MTITPEAHEAAAEAYVAAIANRLIPSRQAAPIMLEAAAPFIAAQALRDTADRYRGKAAALREVARMTKTDPSVAVDVLLYLADELELDAAEMCLR